MQILAKRKQTTKLPLQIKNHIAWNLDEFQQVWKKMLWEIIV